MLKNYPKDKYGLYLVSKNNIEEEIEELLKGYNSELLNDPQAIDIYDFVENELKLNLEFHKICNDNTVYGLFSFTSGSINVYDNDVDKEIKIKEKTVVIDPSTLDISEHLYRFTLGHEAGHYIFQFNLMNKGFDNLIKTDINYLNRQNLEFRNLKRKQLATKEDWMEWQANFAASCILMNRSAMLSLISNFLGYEVHYNSHFLQRMTKSQRTTLVYKISEVFEVSKRAAEIRLIQVSDN